ncbi:MAG: rhomboid family intramembrane serine protease [Clostridia bacterium]|nr:rhomboid family intramembrane serine protease [Clostridia bacterium]
MERKFGRFAIKGLSRYIVFLMAFTYCLIYFLDVSGTYIFKLMLIPDLVLDGEVWRLITFIFIPPTTNLLWVVFALMFYYFIGTTLEREWGSFKFNVYYFTGVLGTIIAAFAFGGFGTSFYLNLTIFLAFARLYPNYEIQLYLVLPIKVKYLAWVDWFYLLYAILTQPVPVKITVIASIVNYLIFFGPEMIAYMRNRSVVYQNRSRFRVIHAPKTAKHKCTVCGATEMDDSKLEFRYCIDCEGDHEYCMEHLNTHEHVREG